MKAESYAPQAAGVNETVRRGGIGLADIRPITRMGTRSFPATLEGLRVLVIEDAPDIRDVFTILLRAEGAQVVSTGSGREAAELAREQAFDVVLSDLGLPDIPGDVLIRQIRAASRGHTRVIAVTGYGEPFISRARQAGAEVVFTKPVEWTRIVDYIKRPGLAA
jgi:two-component system, chemotaxis family, CheB/CheR fusion protein